MRAKVARRRFSEAEAAYLRSTGINPESVTMRVPDFHLGHEEAKELRQVNLKEAYDQYDAGCKEDPVKSDKGIYSLAQALEIQQLDEGLRDRAALAGLDAFDLQLMARGLSVFDPQPMTLADGIFSVDNRAIYPEYVRRAMIETPIAGLGFATVNDIIAGVENFVGASMLAPKMTNTSGEKRKKVAEGGGLPKASLDVSSVSVTPQTLGVEIVVTDKARRIYTVRLLDIFIRQQAVQFDRDRVTNAINKLYAAASAANSSSTATSQKVVPMDLAKEIIHRRKAGYRTDVIAMPTEMLLLYVDNPEVIDPKVSDFLTTGELKAQFGARVLTIDSDTNISTNYQLYIDKLKGVLKGIQAGSELTETQRWIQTLSESYTFSIEEADVVMIGASCTKQMLKA